MADTAIAGYISKAEAAHRYNRDFRTIGKDISTALALRDADFLKHLILRTTKDGEEREGTEVMPDMVMKLQREGRGPKWYLETEYFDTKYREADNETVTEGEPTIRLKRQQPAGDRDVIDVEPADTEALDLLKHPMVQVQANRITELEKDRKSLLEGRESDRKVIDTLNRVLDRLEQDEEERRAQAAAKTSTSRKRAAATVQSRPKATTTRKRAATGKESRRQAKPRPRKAAPTAPKWYEAPTLKSLFSRR